MDGRTAVLLLIVLSVCPVLAPSDKKNLTATSGDDVTLPCSIPDNKDVDSVQWSRKDLDSEDLLFFRPNQPESLTRHPSHVDRVDLQDRQMKNGDVSLALKNVSAADSGTYECRVMIDGHMELICSITLSVSPPGKKDGSQDSGGKSSGSGSSSLTLALKVAAAAAAVFLLLY